jgi:hypothetical protein
VSLGNDWGPRASSNGMQYSNTVTGKRYGNFVASKHIVNDGIDNPIIGVRKDPSQSQLHIWD